MADELKRVGLVFKADGVVDFNNSLKNINNAAKENYANFKLLKSQWDENTSSAKKLADRQSYLQTQTEIYSDKIKILQRELDEMKSSENASESAIQKKQIALKNAQAKLNEYEGALKDVSTQLDHGKAKLQDFADAAEKVGDKVSSAGQSMTKGVTAPLMAIGAASTVAANEVDAAYDEIIKKTGATGDTLESMKDSAADVAKTVNAEFNEISAGLGEVNTRFGFTEDKLEDCTEKFVQFAKINDTDTVTAVRLVARAMGDAGIKSEEYGSVLDALTIAAQASGIEINTLTEMITKYGAPMRALGFDTQQSIALFAGWEKAGVNTEIAFSGMKKAISNWSAEGKDARVEFQKTLEEIKACPDIASATTMAIEIFGQKAGPDLADAIQGGRFEYEEFMKIIQDSEGTVTQTYDAMTGANDKWQMAMNSAKISSAELGMEIMEVLAPLLMELSEVIATVSEWFSNLDEDQKRAIVTIGMIVAAIGPFLVILGTLISSVGTVTSGVKGMIGFFEKVPGITTKVGGGAKALWGILSAHPFGLILAAIAAVIAIFVTLYNKCEWFRTGVDSVMEGVKKIFKGAADSIAGFLDFDWKLPKIKLPHFSITGSFSLAPPRVPKMSVSWYANGGILNSPTIFGMNGGQLLGGGEAGQEAVLPIDLLKDYIREENLQNNQVLASILAKVLKEVFASGALVAENNIYIGDRKFSTLITEMVMKEMKKQSSNYKIGKGITYA